MASFFPSGSVNCRGLTRGVKNNGADGDPSIFTRKRTNEVAATTCKSLNLP